MHSTSQVLLFCLVAGVCAQSGCATIMSGREADVVFKSNPPAAQVEVHNEKGVRVATAVTPAKVSLKRGNGFFKKAPRYVATIEKTGYETQQLSIRPKFNPWVLGNVAIGGVIGLAADSATGAMWKFSPKEIHQDLTPFQSPHYSQSQTSDVDQVAYVSDEPGE